MAKVCKQALYNGKPNCEACTGIDLTTGAKVCNQGASCSSADNLSTCGAPDFNPASDCASSAGSCCDDWTVSGNNGGFGHGVVDVMAAHNALSQDCDCGVSEGSRMNMDTDNICDEVIPTSDEASLSPSRIPSNLPSFSPSSSPEASPSR